ncbi:MAG TPA: lipocalin family protein [Bacteroidota bacterium]|nr:lipocalin family protein [Bacteroidota bacterium]
MKSVLYIIIVLTFTTFASAQESSRLPLRVVTSVDLKQYTGTWFEIARLPNRFQNDCAGDVTATYILLDDGEMKVVNRCRKEHGDTTEAEGLAKRAGDDEPVSKLKVRFAPSFLSFLPFVWGDYWIIDLAADYSYAVIGEPKREYLWVLARTPVMESDTLTQILARVTAQGYDISTIIKTQQTIK